MKFRKVKVRKAKLGPKVRKISKGPRWKVFGGDCLETLKRLKSDSVDVLVTDPPYGIKFMGRDWDKALPPVNVWRECVRVLKPGSLGFVMSSPRQDCLARMILNLEDAGFVVNFTSIYWTYSNGLPKGQAMDKLIDKKLGVERKIVGRNPTWREAKRSNKKYQTVQGGSAEYITEAATNEAKQFDGAYSGFNLKPAVEIIITVMKPLSKSSYTEQALENGKGVTWIEDARIPSTKPVQSSAGKGEFFGFEKGKYIKGVGRRYGNKGRFPANLLVSDDTLNDGTVIKARGGPSGGGHYSNVGYDHGVKSVRHRAVQRFDSGSYSKYFDLDVWADKNLPKKISNVWPWVIVSKPTKMEKNHDGRVDNKHKTVKPVQLMSYLVTLGSRPGDWVLDPYCGSGSTGVAAVALNRRFIGCELDNRWVQLSKDRISDTL